MSGLAIFTLVHVGISLAGIAAGLIVAAGLLASKLPERANIVFLVTTVLTSVTGFFFPFHGLMASHKVGIVSLVVLALAIFARYAGHLAGPWRLTYVIGAMLALYLNVFVLVAQLFGKVPALHALAPTQTEAPFAIAQGIVLVTFVVLSVAAATKFRAA